MKPGGLLWAELTRQSLIGEYKPESFEIDNNYVRPVGCALL